MALRRSFLMALPCLVLALSSATDLPAAARPGAPRESRCSNGVHLVLQPEPTMPIAAVQLWLRTGRADDPPGLQGSADLVTAVLGGPSLRRILSESVPPLTSRGLLIETTCHDDAIMVGLTGPAASAPDMASALARLAAGATATTDDLAGARRNFRSRLLREARDPAAQIEQDLFHLAYSIHPYRHHRLDALDDLDAQSLENLRSELRRRLEPANLVVTAVGGFDAVELHEALQRSFEELGRGAGPPPRPVIVEPKKVRAQSRILHGTFPQNRVALAFLAPPGKAREVFPLMMLTEILGPSSRAELRREILAQLPSGSDLDVDFFLRREPGLLVLSAEGPGLDPDEARARILGVLTRSASRISLVDLARAHRRIEAALSERRATPAGWARELGIRAVIDSQPSLERLFEGLDGVGLDEVAHAVTEYLSDESAVMVAHVRLELPERPRLTSACLPPAPSVTTAASGARLVVTPPPSPDLASCEFILPRGSLPGGPLPAAALSRLTDMLRAELAQGRRARLRGESPTDLASLTLLPTGLDDPPDVLRIGFVCEAAILLDAFEEVLAALGVAQRAPLIGSVLAPETMVISVAAAVDPHALRKTVDRLFARSLSGGPPSSGAGRFVDAPSIVAGPPTVGGASLVLSHAAPAGGTRLEAGAACVARILEDRLRLRVIEERNAAASVRVVYQPMRDEGRFTIVMADVPAEIRAKTHALVEAELRRLATVPSSRDDVTAAAGEVRVQLLQTLLTPSGRAFLTGLQVARGAAPTARASFFEALESVGPADVTEVARMLTLAP